MEDGLRGEHGQLARQHVMEVCDPDSETVQIHHHLYMANIVLDQ
jgi:hypothetical protein